MIECHIDFEWRSAVDIKQGTDAYFACPHSAPLMASYSFDGVAIKRWLPGEPCPGDIRAHAESGGRFVAHNAGNFERKAWARCMTPRYGWPALAIRQWRCTLASASALGLPRSLERLGEALDLPVKKDKIGKSLIKFFCLPRDNSDTIGLRDTEILAARQSGYPDYEIDVIDRKWRPRVEQLRFNEPADHPEKFEQFRAYCDDDVRAECAADARMVPLSDDEQEAWILDQTINDRGVRIDRASAAAAMRLVEKAKAALDAEMARATGGAVRRCSEAAKLTHWLADRHVAIGGVAKNDLLEALEDEDLPAHVRRVLLIRQEAAKTSTAKLSKMLAHSQTNGRVRGRYLYHGTAPGRWSMLDPNLANLPRPRRCYETAAEKGEIDTTALFEAFRSEDPEMLRALYGDKAADGEPETEALGRPLSLVSDALRGFVWAAPSRDLVAVDYSGIQGAINAWLSDETWKLQAMREIIADPKGRPDLYRRAAAGILNTTTDVVTKKHWARQAVGKTSELALGFAGGVRALASMARNYGIKRRQLHDLYPGVWAAADAETREKAEKRYAQVMNSRRREDSDILSREAWLACSVIVRGWRATNPAAVKAWEALEAALREAVREPGRKVNVLGRVSYLSTRGFLWCRLPSGRCIAYPSPKLRDQVWARPRLLDGSFGEPEVMDREEAEGMERKGDAKIDGATSPKVTALGVDSTTQKLQRYAVYGGLAMENLSLGTERDILLRGMRNCEAAGYPIVMHTYDEAVAEMPCGQGSVEEMEHLMLRLDPWAEGLPLAAHGWRGKRYRK